MTQFAYRFVPLQADGRPLSGARYVTTVSHHVRPGDTIRQTALGSDAWEVVEVQESAGDKAGLQGVTNDQGRDVPVVGTIICKAVK